MQQLRTDELLKYKVPEWIRAWDTRIDICNKLRDNELTGEKYATEVVEVIESARPDAVGDLVAATLKAGLSHDKESQHAVRYRT